MEMITMRPPRIGMALMLIAGVAHWILKAGDPIFLASPTIGLMIGTGGFVLMLWSWLLFKKKNVAICPRAKTARIIQSGPYSFSRNSMYLGMILMMLGPALFTGAASLYLSALIYFLILNFVFCPFEEAKLLIAFGDEYAQYCSKVRRWL